MNTQIETKDGTYSTDVKKWGEFTKAYYRDTKEVNLLVSCGTSQSTRQVAKMSLQRFAKVRGKRKNQFRLMGTARKDPRRSPRYI